MLIVLGGLPGTGKTSIARELAQQVGGMHLRIDTIEQALRPPGMAAGEIGLAGYLVAYGIAEDNLRLGNLVIADAVNPLQLIRNTWRALAARCHSRIVEIELVCSDPKAHRRRVERRKADIPGHQLPTWQEVVERVYEPWEPAPIVIDTARLSADVIVEELFERIGLEG